MRRHIREVRLCLWSCEGVPARARHQVRRLTVRTCRIWGKHSPRSRARGTPWHLRLQRRDAGDRRIAAPLHPMATMEIIPLTQPPERPIGGRGPHEEQGTTEGEQRARARKGGFCAEYVSVGADGVALVPAGRASYRPRWAWSGDRTAKDRRQARMRRGQIVFVLGAAQGRWGRSRCMRFASGTDSGVAPAEVGELRRLLLLEQVQSVLHGLGGLVDRPLRAALLALLARGFPAPPVGAACMACCAVCPALFPPLLRLFASDASPRAASVRSGWARGWGLGCLARAS